MNINYNNHYISSILKAEQLLKLLHSISSRIIANSTEQNHRRKNVNRHSQRKNTHRLTKFSPHQEILYFPRDFLNRGVKPTLALGHGRLACPYVFTMVFTHTNLSDPIKRSVNWFGFPNADCELWRKKKEKVVTVHPDWFFRRLTCILRDVVWVSGVRMLRDCFVDGFPNHLPKSIGFGWVVQNRIAKRQGGNLLRNDCKSSSIKNLNDSFEVWIDYLEWYFKILV